MVFLSLSFIGLERSFHISIISCRGSMLINSLLSVKFVMINVSILISVIKKQSGKLICQPVYFPQRVKYLNFAKASR